MVTLRVLLLFIIGGLIKLYRIQKQKNQGLVYYKELITSDYQYFLYLRAFDDDGKGLYGATNPYDFFNVFGTTYESEIARNFKNKMLVTIGKPNEKLPELGAIRLYIKDVSWEKKIENLINKSFLIIMKPSNSKGLNKELDIIFKKKLINKLIISHRFSDYRNKDLNEFYYNQLSGKIMDSLHINMLPFNRKMRYSYFTENHKHRQVKSLKEITNKYVLINYELNKYISRSYRKTYFDIALESFCEYTIKILIFFFLLCGLYMLIEQIY